MRPASVQWSPCSLIIHYHAIIGRVRQGAGVITALFYSINFFHTWQIVMQNQSQSFSRDHFKPTQNLLTNPKMNKPINVSQAVNKPVKIKTWGTNYSLLNIAARITPNAFCSFLLFCSFHVHTTFSLIILRMLQWLCSCFSRRILGTDVTCFIKWWMSHLFNNCYVCYAHVTSAVTAKRK